jgi:hypothetical protein
MKQAANLLYAGFLLDSLFDPEDRGDMFLRNVGSFSTGYTTLYPRDITIHNHRCENLKSYRLFLYWAIIN